MEKAEAARQCGGDPVAFLRVIGVAQNEPLEEIHSKILGLEPLRSVEMRLNEFSEAPQTEWRVEGAFKSSDSSIFANSELTRDEFSALFSSVPFPECILAYPVSVRLRNALISDHDSINDRCADLGNFLRQSVAWIRSFAKSPNVGRTCVLEAEEILMNVVSALLQELSDKKVIVAESCDFNLLASNLVKTDGRRLSLDRQSLNTSLVGQFILDWESVVANGAADPLVKSALEAMPANSYKELEGFLKRELSTREFDVVSRRCGFSRGRRQTLQEIADGYGITRERIRQLEAKAIKNCSAQRSRSIFIKFIELEIEAVLPQLIGDRLVISKEHIRTLRKDLPGQFYFCCIVAFESIEKFADEYLTPIFVGGEHLGWCRSSSSEEKIAQYREILFADKNTSQTLTTLLRKSFEIRNWPFTVSGLAQAHRSFSREEIQNVLVGDFGARIVGDDIHSIERLSAKTRLILTLRNLARPEHLSIVRAHHNKLFGIDISEHAAGAVLARLEEALIVDRGTYGLYEHLPLSKNEVTVVRDYCHENLRGQQTYVSAKILAKTLALANPQIASRLTAYIVLGVCQDDARFSIRRGLMVGLAEEGFEEHFASLAETIFSIVERDGPISISGIKSRMADTRDILDTSVSSALECSMEIVRTSGSKYDTIDRVFGPTENWHKLIDTIMLCLIDGPCSSPVLNSRLSALGYTYGSVAVFSFVRTLDSIRVSNSLISLLNGYEHIELYNRTFKEVFDPDATTHTNKIKIAALATNLGVAHLVNHDFRLVVAPDEWDADWKGDDETNSIIDEMMEEFDF